MPEAGRIRETLEHRDQEALYRCIHTLKGTIGNFSAEPAFKAAGHLEEVARTEDLAAAQRALAKLEAELDRLQQTFRFEAEQRVTSDL